jgi:hypothetical protein
MTKDRWAAMIAAMNCARFESGGQHFSIIHDKAQGELNWYVDKWRDYTPSEWIGFARGAVVDDVVVWMHNPHLFFSKEDQKIAEEIILRLHKIRLFL